MSLSQFNIMYNVKTEQVIFRNIYAYYVICVCVSVHAIAISEEGMNLKDSWGGALWEGAKGREK